MLVPHGFSPSFLGATVGHRICSHGAAHRLSVAWKPYSKHLKPTSPFNNQLVLWLIDKSTTSWFFNNQWWQELVRRWFCGSWMVSQHAAPAGPWSTCRSRKPKAFGPRSPGSPDVDAAALYASAITSALSMLGNSSTTHTYRMTISNTGYKWI